MAEPASSTLIADIASLVRAVGALLWPLVAGYVVVRNEKQIKNLLERLRKGKILGQEIELEGSLKDLKRQVSAVEDETPSSPIPVNPELSNEINVTAERISKDAPALPASKPFHEEADPFLNGVLDTAAKSPTVALMQLASGIEKLANKIWNDLDDGSKPLRPSVKALIDGLSHVLPRSVPSALRAFWNVRNTIVHGRDSDEQETLSALDSGISLYRSLDSFSRSYAVVLRSEIPLYTDETGETVNPHIRGIELEFRSNGHRMVWPTKKAGYVPQMIVRTEFDTGNPVNDTWIKNPDTGHAIKIFDSAALFVGEPISVQLRS